MLPMDFAKGEGGEERSGRAARIRFPLWPLPLALVATLLIATLVVRLPVRRAVRLRPGVALRYE